MLRRATAPPVLKKLALYVKPEERKAYYVINEKATGSIEF